MRVQVQQGKVVHSFEFKEDEVASTRVEALQRLLEQKTGLFPRNQKLIYKGTVLLPHFTFEQSKLVNGSKILLLASSGPTLGQAAAEKLANEKAEQARRKAEQQALQKERTAARQRRQDAKALADTASERAAMWTKTGIIALRAAGLTALPQEVWQNGAVAQVADFGDNALASIPLELSKLTALHKLRLSHNLLTSSGLPETLFQGITKLQVLSLDFNRLIEVPSSLTILQNLELLDLSHNTLMALPGEIGRLTNLQLLSLASNGLSVLPASLGKCASLTDLNVSNNRLAAVPVALSNLQLLRKVDFNRNRIQAFPGEILLHCSALHTINLHQNLLTIELLREMPEYKEFDQRRRSKYSKQMDMHVMSPAGGFDEGADHG